MPADQEPGVGIDGPQPVEPALECRELLRIGARDVLSFADLVHTGEDLSTLAEACLEAALTTIQDCEDSVAAVDAESKPQISFRGSVAELLDVDLVASAKKEGF